MSEIVPGGRVSPIQRALEVTDPITGELVDLADQAAALEFLYNLRETRQRYMEMIRYVERLVVEHHMEREGTGTLNAGQWIGTRKTKRDYEWDEQVLLELVDAGLPTARYEELVETVTTTKVSQNVAKQLEAANPAYKEIIERARTVREKPQGVDVEPSKAAIRGT